MATNNDSSTGASLNAEGEGNGRTVCVTGANGFIGSWMVCQLLERGYKVHGTVRNPENKGKNGHLWELKGADKRLKLFKADVMDYDAVAAAVAGCEGVFHTACPLLGNPTDPQREVIDPSVKGTKNVIEASVAAGVRRVIHFSSCVACMYTEGQARKVPDENTFVDPDFFRKIGMWYTVAKVEGEKAAWELAEKKGVDFISIVPGLSLGPILQKEINASSELVYGLFLGEDNPYTYLYGGPVDVRDVAASAILLFETPSASGRYICMESWAPWSDIMQTVGKLYPRHNIPQTDEDTQPWLEPCKLPSKRLQELGVVFRPLLESMKDLLQGFEDRGLIPTVDSKQE